MRHNGQTGRQISVSVIIPVYNVERWLPQCLKSVINQTFTDFEVLLIDDGSTDGSAKLCDDWAKQDERIRVEHKKMKGLPQPEIKEWSVPKENILYLLTQTTGWTSVFWKSFIMRQYRKKRIWLSAMSGG